MTGREGNVERAVVFASPWCRVLAQPLPDGQPYYMLEVPDYVSIIARTPAGCILLVRQHRPIVGAESVELPSGHIEAGESSEAAARRELLEETGMLADHLECLGTLMPDVGRLTNRLWCYFAADVRRAPAAEPEQGISVLEVPDRDALAMAVDGRLSHALDLASLFLAVSKGRLSLA